MVSFVGTGSHGSAEDEEGSMRLFQPALTKEESVVEINCLMCEASSKRRYEVVTIVVKRQANLVKWR